MARVLARRCNYWAGSVDTVYFTAAGSTADADEAGVLKGQTAVPQRCAAACDASATCSYSFYKLWHGECRLLHGSASCASRISTWVGEYDAPS